MRFGAIILTLFLAAGSHMTHAIEEPSFELAGQVGDVELRDYAATIQARTSMGEDSGTASPFRRLANFIFGDNSQESEIAMTAPVETRDTEDGYMAFTMPSEYSMEDLPAPLDDSVSLHEVPPRRMAALSFGGWATDGKVERMTVELFATLEENGIETVGPPALNQYNPPWTLPWKRRNEVVVEIVK